MEATQTASDLFVMFKSVAARDAGEREHGGRIAPDLLKGGQLGRVCLFISIS